MLLAHCRVIKYVHEVVFINSDVLHRYLKGQHMYVTFFLMTYTLYTSQYRSKSNIT